MGVVAQGMVRRGGHGVGKFGQSSRKHWMSPGQIFLDPDVPSGIAVGYDIFV